MIQIEISPGELLDRLAILTIKSERFTDAEKRRRAELAMIPLLWAVAETFGPTGQSQGWDFYGRLKAANQAIWDAEEDIRQVDWANHAQVVVLARQLHQNNDLRFSIKREVDEAMGAQISEEKSYL